MKHTCAIFIFLSIIAGSHDVTDNMPLLLHLTSALVFLFAQYMQINGELARFNK